jgi:hypothetical protein
VVVSSSTAGKPPPPKAAAGSSPPVRHPIPPSPWQDEAQRSLLGPTTLVLMITAVATVLVLVFPGENYNDPRYIADADGVSLAYLRAILRVRPDDPQLRVALARQQLAFALLEDAFATLAPVVADDQPVRGDAEKLVLEIERRRFYQLPPSHPGRPALRARIIRRIERFGGAPIPPGALDLLARTSLEMGEPARAARFYLRSAPTGGPLARDRYEKAARCLLAAGDPEGASEAFRQASLVTADGPAARALELEAVDALVAAAQQARALALLETLLARPPHSLALLDRAFALALALGRREQASAYAAERAALAPEDLSRLTDHGHLEVATGHVQGALAVAQAIVARRPQDAEERRHLAELAEWAGELPTALEAWSWLARRGDRAALERGLRVAFAVYDWRSVLELLKLEDGAGRIAHEQLLALVRTLEEMAAPEAAAATVLEQGDLDDRRTWELLAALHERAGHLDAALDDWRQITSRFGRRLPDLVRQARLLWQLDAPDQARLLLESGATLARPEDESYHRLLAELAFSQGVSAAALDAYRVLWQTRKSTPDEMARLLRLLDEGGRDEELVTIGREAWERSKNPEFLVQAMSAAVRGARWDDLEAVLADADRNPEPFQGREPYWLAHALLAQVRGRPGEVEKSYQRALVANPLSHQARLGWLWFALDRDDRPRLRQLAADFRGLASVEADYARPYAATLDRLGRLRDALPFYDRAARAAPTDVVLLEQYADALERAHLADPAHRVRRFALQARGREAVASLTVKSGQHPDLAPMVAYARGLWREGTSTTARLAHALCAAHPERQDVERLGFDVDLADGNLPGVRAWLDRLGRAGAATPVERAALALAENDNQALTQAATVDAGALTVSDRILIERRLGRREVARSLLLAALAASPPLPDDERDGLIQQLLEMNAEEDASIKAELGTAARGPVEIEEERVMATYALTPGLRLSGYAAHLRLSSRDDAVWGGAPESHGDLALSAALEGRRLRGSMLLGAQPGPDHLAPLMSAEVGTRLPELGGSSRLDLGAALHEPSRDGGLLLLVGRRDRLEARLRFAFGSEYALATAQLRREATRDGEWLGDTRMGALELGTHLSLIPELRLFVQGIAATSDRAAGVPALLQARLGRTVGLDALVAPSWAAALAGLSLASGPAIDSRSRLRWTLDANAGWMNPARMFVFRLEGGAGLRLFAHNVLALRAFLARGQGGRPSEQEQGLWVSYEVSRN